MICYLFSEPIYLIFSKDVPVLLYYSHILTAVIAILIGFFVYKNGKKFLLNKLLFAITICFSIWVVSNLILWTNIHSNIMMLVWSFLRVFSSLISVLSIYFIYVFLEKRDISILLKIIFIFLIVPVVILAPTHLNLSGFNILDCDAFMFEGVLFQFYRVFFGILAMVWILILLVRKYRIVEPNIRKQILFMGIGIELFLFLFFIVTFLAAYFTKIGILNDSRIEYYGLFGMVIFVIYLSILIVRFKTFNVKLVATQALVWGLIILIGAQFFFISGTTNLILNSVAFVGVIIFGQLLFDSVRKEIEQKEKLLSLATQLEDTNQNLEVANEKLKGLDKLKSEFVSLASHQLRSPLTAIKGYTSMLIEGDYGEINPEAKETISRIMESSNNLSIVVEDLLNVTKIEQGGMKYVMVPFDFTDLILDTVKDLSITAEGKGLKLICKISPDDKHSVNGDKEKVRQILINLLDNSMKYTKQGQIEVDLHCDNNKARLSIKDTGVGISKEAIGDLFKKFSREDRAKLNSTGSGLGLYLVKEIVDAHKGNVWVESEGEGKGSTFFVEFDEVK